MTHKRARILLVDDLPDNLRTLSRILADSYELTVATSGSDALAIAEASLPDLILLDVMMPGLDGLEVLQRLRASPWGKAIPVILVTADDRAETQIRGLELGADDFLTKPLVLPAVMCRVRNALARHRLQQKQTQLIAELSRSNVELRRLSELNAALLASAGQGIFSTDLNRICTSINPAGQAILGYREDELIGLDQHAVFHHHRLDGSDYPEEECPVFKTLQDGETRIVEDHFITKEGVFVPVQLTVSAMRSKGKIVGSEVLFQDISERQRLQDDLLRLATTDALTGLYNRGHFFERAEAEKARAERYGYPLACLILDLDRFKQINDSHGHATGDAALVAVAATLRGLLRGADVIGRIGGEEFALLLPQTDVAGATAFAERLRKSVAALDIPRDQESFRVTISIGVATVEATDSSIAQALRRADQALYEAKLAGRDRVVTATS